MAHETETGRAPIRLSALRRLFGATGKVTVALLSVALSVVLTAGKLLIGLVTGSLALIADALQGLGDIVIALVTLFVVIEADRGSDARYTCGRARLEALAALAEAALLAVMGIAIWYLGLEKLFAGPGEIRVEPWFLLAVAGAVISDLLRHLMLRRAARRTGSMALAANAAHFLTDAVASLCVLGGLLAAAAGWPAADTYATLAVAALLFLSAWRVGRPAADILLDRSDPARSTALLADLEALGGVEAVRRLAIRPGVQGHATEIVLSARVATCAEMAGLAEAARTCTRAHFGPGTVTVEIGPVRGEG